ncbi:MAG TPA: DUF488 family protein [Mycobacteriales bacterium]|nr:DUF488 family protein [Mycobacteriales bacterium]
MREFAGPRIARIYAAPSPDDGIRVLVDRLWPRGLSRQAAALDEWCRTVAPSTDLRQWYSHDPSKSAEFEARYRAELVLGEPAEALALVRQICRRGPTTLLTASAALEISHAAVLARIVQEPSSPGSGSAGASHRSDPRAAHSDSVR